jgi:tRNA pseudouridine55 synthase
VSTSGILLVDKPGGITSHDAVSRVRKLAGTRKVGHAGTLDPMATGLLILGIDSSTRLLTYLVGLDKEYLATIRFGFATTTDDAEGEVIGEPVDTGAVTTDAIAAAIRPLTGVISQIPSSVSAIKVDGKRSYDRVRAGEEFTLAAREVTIEVFEVLETRPGEVDVRVECSSGTYIRALARDLGAALGVGGHLTALRRTLIGPFSIDEAVPLDDELAARLLDPADVAKRLFGHVDLTLAQATDLAHGKKVALEGVAGGPLAAVAPNGRLVGLVEVVDDRARILVNFPMDTAPQATETNAQATETNDRGEPMTGDES